ncbi:DJ-1/PfpI family protein [Paludibaculum fermentans]|uniref:DJ-1/PfpI family protein n=1 Tax=Paludibaculum fermentans TaxID=1473598 RepID=A0A7S7NNM6_PALFE|nr:DJ-1/PfpI family protein [Paludibaculum fermentans]QOY86953.1 DJ-1/PfpI family protein [Paludibaculum fermentans]
MSQTCSRLLFAVLLPLTAVRGDGTVPQRTAAVVLFPGAQVMGYAAPIDILRYGGTSVFTVAEQPTVVTNGDLSVNAQYTFENAPDPDILLVPGSSNMKAELENPRLLSFLRDKAGKAQVVLSVSNGSFLLGKAGLLDDHTATATFGLTDGLRRIAPLARVVDDVRYTDSGKYVTSAGLSAGIDAALHVLEKLDGRGAAQMAALAVEYNWDPEGSFVRSQLADRLCAFRYAVTSAQSIRREGDEEQWVNEWAVTDPSSPEVVFEAFQTAIRQHVTWMESTPQWTKIDGEDAPLRSQWRFRDERDRSWRGVLEVTPNTVSGQGVAVRLSLHLDPRRASI